MHRSDDDFHGIFLNKVMHFQCRGEECEYEYRVHCNANDIYAHNQFYFILYCQLSWLVLIFPFQYQHHFNK